MFCICNIIFIVFRSHHQHHHHHHHNHHHHCHHHLYHLVCLTTRPKHLPKPIFQGVWSSAFCFNFQYLLISLRSSSSCFVYFVIFPSHLQGDSFGTRPKKMQISQRLFIRFWTCIYDYIPCFMRRMSILVCHCLISWCHRDDWRSGAMSRTAA